MEDPCNYSTDPIIVDEPVDDDMELKMKYVRALGLFFLLQECNNFNFTTDAGKATPQFSSHIQCVQRIRDLGEIFEELGHIMTPSILKQCGM